MEKHILLCLHGWGGTKESFAELREALKDAPVEILAPDLPGFGQEPEPPRPWTVDDYATWIEQWLKKNTRYQIPDTRYHLLGHSHGGRIAIKLAIRGNIPIGHLYLCAAAGIRRPRHWKRILGLILAKTGKFLFRVPVLRRFQPLGRALLYRLIRVHDYERASPLMQQTLIEVTKEDLRPLLPKITVPTDIFWGQEDRMTPVRDAHVMHGAIRGSTLHIYPGVRHRVHRDRAGEIAAAIQDRMGIP